ncbi:MAG: SSU ribosomal protein S20p, partial [uncultured Sphingomonas sp.]
GEHAASQEAHPPQRSSDRNQRRARRSHPDLHQGRRERAGLRRQDGCRRSTEEGAAGAGARRGAWRDPQEHGEPEVLPPDQANFGAQL